MEERKIAWAPARMRPPSPAAAAEAEGPRGEPIRGDKVEIQLFTTLKCNISCDYCVMSVGGALGSQGKPTYTVGELERFVETNLAGKSLYFTFFGGEPLLNRKFIRETMERFGPKGARFQLQTNGTLLTRLDADLLGRFSNALVSIDGIRERTDAHRGEGTHARVLENVRAIRPLWRGSLTARMTWLSEETGLEDVLELLEDFDFAHFQFAQDTRELTRKSLERKKERISELLEACYPDGGLLNVIPAMGAARAALFPADAWGQCGGKTQCRVSTNLVNVRPDGEIYACPDMTWESAMRHGSVKGNWLSRSPLQPTPNMPCGSCPAQSMCLGNCMKNLWMAYEKNDEAWRLGITEPTCELSRHFMAEAKRLATRPGWLESLSDSEVEKMRSCEIYDYVEIAP